MTNKLFDTRVPIRGVSYNKTNKTEKKKLNYIYIPKN